MRNSKWYRTLIRQNSVARQEGKTSGWLCNDHLVEGYDCHPQGVL